jgi:hypothetical protein
MLTELSCWNTRTHQENKNASSQHVDVALSTYLINQLLGYYPD